MPNDTDDQTGVSLPTGRRTLMGALAAGVGLSALGGAAADEHLEQGTDTQQPGTGGETLLAALSDSAVDVDSDGFGAFVLDQPAQGAGGPEQSPPSESPDQGEPPGQANETSEVGTADQNETTTNDTEVDTGTDQPPGQAGGQLEWSLLIEQLQGVTAAHIHEGGPEEDGPVVAPLVEYEAFGSEEEYADQVEQGEPGADVMDQAFRNASEEQPLFLTGTLSGGEERPMAGQDGNVTAGGDNATAGGDNVTAGGQDNTTVGGQDNATVGGQDNATAGGQNATQGGMQAGEAQPGTTDHQVDSQTLDQIVQNPGDYYVNVHTVENPGGEIRGQLRSEMSVQMEPGTGTQPANETTAAGPDNETGVGADNETGVGADDDTGVGADNQTGDGEDGDGGILDGGEDGGDGGGGDGGDGGDGGIFD